MTTATAGQARVVAIKGEDRFACLDQALAETGFYDVLEMRCQELGKERERLLVVVKPNFMMAYSRHDPTTSTDLVLVEHLIDEMVSRGFTNVAVVESRNSYGNWFRKREVATVARFVGYQPGGKYRLVDLTEEKVPYDYGGRLGRHWVGPTWRDADFRISFAKNKTHSHCYYTLTIKNIYGCTPLQNKLDEYHKKRDFDWPTIEMLRHFPVHFGIIDAWESADGMMGVKYDDDPNPTRAIIAGENIVAVDWVGATKMGLDPMVSSIFSLAVREFGLPEVEWLGDRSVYQNWVNIPPGMAGALDRAEKWYTFFNLLGFFTTRMDPFFPPKGKYRAINGLRRFFHRLGRWLARLG